MKFFLVVVIGYLLGSIPHSVLAGKIMKNIDIRQYGSGNAGATNALRVLGVKPAVAVFIADVIKGVIAALIGRWIAGDVGAMLAGGSAVIGHDWSIFLNFNGGKGISTSFGVLLVLFPKITIILFVVDIVIITTTRYVSLASITATILLPILLIILRYSWQAILFGLFLSCLALYRHRSNISRLLSGTENKLGEGTRVK